MSKKMLPIGISDFKELIKKNYYFVDKSLLIEEILEKGAKVTLLPRPRRFGKTLNMSMLKYFFNIENREENKVLFEGLLIEKTKYIKEQGKYPVIHISLKDIKTNTWKECLEKIKIEISILYENYSFIKDKLSDVDKKIFEEIVYKRSDIGTLSSSIMYLSKMLKDYYGKEVVILIDEYDTPLTSSYVSGYYDEAISFFRNMLGAALKDNIHLAFGIITGITKVAKESIFSGLNNLTVGTILDNKYRHFGLKENEVEELLKYYNLEYHIEEVRKWYNGYKFGEDKVYNPWSIINYATDKKIKAYWINTSNNDLIKNLLKNKSEEIQEDLEELFLGKEVEKTIVDGIIYSDLNRLSTIWSLFFFSGYLTYEKEIISAITGDITYSLKIPNEEVRSFFRGTFLEYSSEGRPELYSKMMENLYYGDIGGFSKRLKENYKLAVSYHDTATNEKYYHNFMLGLLLILVEKYEILSNRESGEGRYDIAMYPKEKGHHGIIFEFKYSKDKNNLENSSKEALEQIREKNYLSDMKGKGIEKIICIGIAFSGKELEIKYII
ncbi:MAG: AAA family ATPase [Fusobacteriaceae bacterium]